MIIGRDGSVRKHLQRGQEKLGISPKHDGPGKVHAAQEPRGADADHDHADGVELGAGQNMQAVADRLHVLVISS